ncbi:MAG: hypothetical protein HQM10_11790 [Candidatus Riflebacteria bacterium]|nr:hypothetical protein [Candidatus Riflebacteria bacterium]
MSKRTSRIFTSSLLSVLFILAFTSVVSAQYPSLGGSDLFEVTVDNEGSEETFTVIRDGNIEDRFYYVPVRPQIACETIKGKKSPIFQLVSWQTKNAKGEEVTGGLLQFSAKLGISQATQKNIAGAIQKAALAKNPVICPLPISSASVTLYSMAGDLVANAPEAPGVAPLFGTQHIPFMVNLTDVGADVMETLCRGKGGLPVLVTFAYPGLTPKGGFKIVVNWDTTYKMFSTDTKLNAELAYQGMGVNAGLGFATVRDELISKGALKVTSMANEAISSEELDKYMDPIIKTLTDEMMGGMKAPEKIDPEKAKDIAAPKEEKEEGIVDQVLSVPEKIGEKEREALQQTKNLLKFASVGVGFQMKDVKQRKTGTVEYVFERQKTITRVTSCGGAMGIGRFDKEIQDACITVVPPGQWEKCMFRLPSVGEGDNMGLTSIDMTITAYEGSKDITSTIGKQTAKYKKLNGEWTWTTINPKDKKEASVDALDFIVKHLYADPKFESKRASYKFKVETLVTIKGQKSLKFVKEQPIFRGTEAFVTPEDLVDTVKVEASFVDYDNDKDRVSVQLKMSSPAGNDILKATLNSQNDYTGKLFVPTNVTSLIADISKVTKDSGNLKYIHNGKDIRTAAEKWMELSFRNEDFVK